MKQSSAMSDERPADDAALIERAGKIIMDWHLGNAGEDDAFDTARLIFTTLNAELSERIEEGERLRGALSKVKVLIVKQYEFDKSNEDGSPYREGAADSSCDLLNDAVPIIDAALSTPSRGGR